MPLPFLCQHLPYAPPFLTRKLINCIYLTFSLNLLTFYLWSTLLCMANFHDGKVSDRMLWIYVSMNVQLCDSECYFKWRVFTLIPHLCLFLSVFWLSLCRSVCLVCPHIWLSLTVSKSLYLPFLVACTRLYTLPCRSVGPSVGHISEFRAVFAVLLLPNRPRLECRVSGLAKRKFACLEAEIFQA